MPEGSRNYIKKPEGWISLSELDKDSNGTPIASAEKTPSSIIIPTFDQHSAPSSSNSSAASDKLSECDDDINSCTNESSSKPSELNDEIRSERSKLTSSLAIEEEKSKHEIECNSCNTLEDDLERAEPIPVEGMETGENILETTGKIDQRKFNRGQAKRKSYE